MRIIKLTIKNFRSYYGTKIFNFSSHLNLILGANGDGKSTFFDALYWVLLVDTPTGPSDLRANTSAKLIEEIPGGNKGIVEVSISLEHNHKQYFLEKSYEVHKDINGKLSFKNFLFDAYKTTASLTRKNAIPKDVLENEGVFPAVIKKYCLFKGEEELNIFKDKDTLKSLINIYSDVKDFEPYIDFAETAEELASKAQISAISKKKVNEDKLKSLQVDLEKAKRYYQTCTEQIDSLNKTYLDESTWLKNYQENADLIEAVNNMQENVHEMEREKEITANKLDDNYSIKLLDENWILYGFTPILDEFSTKMSNFSSVKKELQNKHILEIAEKEAEKKAIKKAREEIKAEMSKLPWYIPDIETMKNMVSNHKCLVCGTEAPDGSAAYKHMYDHLMEALNHKQNEEELISSNENDDKVEPLFKSSYIDELHQLSISLTTYGDSIRSLEKAIKDKFEENTNIEKEIQSINFKINDTKNKISRLIAQSNNSEEITDFHNLWMQIRHRMDNKEDAFMRIKEWEAKLPQAKGSIDELQNKISKLANTPESVLYSTIYEFFKYVRRALQNVKNDSYSSFLRCLEDKANEFLAKLNVDDFTGVIRMTSEGENIKVYLFDDKDNRIEKPNTSLQTTMYISVLLAISELTKENRSNEYPLIFDAPTSNFDSGKDQDFYECLVSEVDKQCIVVTKSYLERDENGNFVEDKEQLEKISKKSKEKGHQCTIFRISKKEGFGKTELSSIETTVSTLYSSKS